MKTKTFCITYVCMIIVSMICLSSIEKKEILIEETSTVPMIEVYYKVPVTDPITSSVNKVSKFDVLVKTTWRLETGNGTSDKWVYNNNAGGIKCYEQKSDSDGFCIYETEEEGMNELRELLISYVSDLGYDYRAIRNKYCPIVDDGCIGDYERFMEVLEEVERRS